MRPYVAPTVAEFDAPRRIAEVEQVIALADAPEPSPSAIRHSMSRLALTYVIPIAIFVIVVGAVQIWWRGRLIDRPPRRRVSIGL